MEEKQNVGTKFKNFCKECGRVLKITKKPTSQEFKITVIVTGIGMLIIGFIGFVITMIRQLMFQ
ncbi:protein translocase SEC61 complex subunit gamma [Candidatus Woesearchaeota archaeon]|nr:protein translocase SEC61 complex subunit gamma [Candidatus Woesearchaeota archaeon]